MCIRDRAGEDQKSGTPTMGGLIILSAIIIPTILFAKLQNIYIQVMLISTIWLGLIGFVDDYIKVFKKDKKGLAGKFKILGQVGLGLLVGLIMVFHSDIVVKEKNFIKNMRTVYRESEDQLPGIDTTMQ